MNAQTNKKNSPGDLEQKYKYARENLLIMIALTVVNVILLFVKSDMMLLFSATVPYISAILGIGFVKSGILTISVLFFGIAFVSLAFYFLCWIFSKKHYGWMIAALVMFSIDTVVLVISYLLAEDFSGIVDFIIHAIVLFYLITGVINGRKLKNLSPEYSDTTHFEQAYNTGEFEDFSAQTTTPFTDNTVNDSPILRSADMNVKSRIFIETEYNGHHICYRRVKRINELVIDGYVYDDVEMLIETSYALNAHIDNHRYQVGYDGAFHSYLRVDGVEIAKKLRLY